MIRPCAFSAAASICSAVLFTAWPGVGQELSVTPTRIVANIEADSDVSGAGGYVLIRGTTGPTQFSPVDVPFKAGMPRTDLPPNGPRFLITAPARGTTRPSSDPGIRQPNSVANGAVGLDPDVVPFLRPGVYSAAFGWIVDLPGEPRGAGGRFDLTIRTPPPPAITGVVNAASFRPVIALGSVVSIFGTNLGSPARAAKFNEFGVYPSDFGNSSVTFNGVAAPLTYVHRTQINAIVPHEVAGQISVHVVVRHFHQQSAEFVVPLEDTAPGIFTASQDGNGQGAFLQTPPLRSFPVTVNSADNPVEKGGALVIFATGGGLWNQDVSAGQVLFAPWGTTVIRPRAAVSVKIGGLDARLLYAGGAPGTAGLIQVNAIVPEEVASGAQPVELTVGQNSNAAQQQVTVAVR